MTAIKQGGLGHGGNHPQLHLPPISQKLAARNEQIKPAALMRRSADALPEQRTQPARVRRQESPEIAMFRNIQTLVAIQEHVLRWRRLAAEVTNPQTARRLRELADEMEVRARELDRQ